MSLSTHPAEMPSAVPVIDIFAGPGGLGEGFTSHRDSRGNSGFEIALSIEKDASAHATLRTRAFQRSLNDVTARRVWSTLSSGASWCAVASMDQRAAAAAEHEAALLELSNETANDANRLVERAVRGSDRWVLLGGPPCQAYSLVGRARNRGNSGYRAEDDHRTTLYVEYLQVLVDHAPPVFVMENVKGMLSATLDSKGLFDRVLTDLTDPFRALKREGRHAHQHPTYELHALVPSDSLFATEPRSFIVRCEDYGIPQARHRIIILGVRRDIGRCPQNLTVDQQRNRVKDAIMDLPPIRSGLSKDEDSSTAWKQGIRSLAVAGWLKGVAPELRREIHSSLERVRTPRDGRGAELLRDKQNRVVLNHSSRSHIVQDLHRYFYAACYARVHGRSPGLQDFPDALHPKHRNVARALRGGLFSDRFRVQVAGRPSSTITSHISKDGHYFIHPDPTQCRSLTVREAARLQTFPDDYFFCGPRTSQYQQVGNAVPPSLARQIAGIVFDLIG